jgi:hypothetical protein
MPNSKKKLLSDAERQAFIDRIPEDQRNPNPKKTFDELIERASTTPIPRESGQSVDGADYTDIQIHSRNTEDISGSRSDTSRQSNASSDSKNPR